MPEGAGEEDGGGLTRSWGQISNGYISKTVRDNPIIMVHFFRLNRVRAIEWDRFQSARTTYKRDSGSWWEFGPCTTERVGNDGFPYQRTFDKVSNP